MVDLMQIEQANSLSRIQGLMEEIPGLFEVRFLANDLPGTANVADKDPAADAS